MLASPIAFLYSNSASYIFFLAFWGFVVIPDSPQFSALTAKAAPPELVGTAVTAVTCIGFALTIPSIEITNALNGPANVPPQWILIHVFVGPVFGLYSIWKLRKLPPPATEVKAESELAPDQDKLVREATL